MTFRAALRERAVGTHARIVFAEGNDPRIRAAARTLAELEIAEPIGIGLEIDPSTDDRRPAVAELLRRRHPNATRNDAHALELASDPLRFAAGLVALGEADACLAGAVYPTADVIRTALWLVGMAPEQRTLSAAMYLGFDQQVLTFTDIAVVPSPDPEQMAESALVASRARRLVVGDEPVVAFLSFSTKGSASSPDVERVRAAADRFHELAPDVLSDGELQLDAALVPSVALRKCPGSPVAGRANVLVFPSLDAANIGYKLCERLAGATAAGPLLQGLARPMSDLSRGAEADDIVDVAAMLALLAGIRTR
ncbi:MAG: phosphate acyltransferase [Gemmatimonadales bacterium]